MKETANDDRLPRPAMIVPPTIGQQPDPRPAHRRRQGFFTGAVGGLLLAALAVSILVTSGRLQLSDPGPATAEIALPAELAGMTDYLAAYAISGTSTTQQSKETARIQRTYQLTAKTYSTAFNGAAAATKQYVNHDFSMTFTVVAVRAYSTPLLAGVLDDPQDLGLIALPTEVRQLGAVSCLVRRFIHGPGSLEPLNQQTDECQRGGPNAAVWVFIQGADTSTAQQMAVAATNAAFDSLSN